MKTIRRLGNAARGASISSWLSSRRYSSLPRLCWLCSGSSTTKPATASKTNPSCSTFIPLSWLADTSRCRDSVSWTLRAYQDKRLIEIKFSSRASIPHLSLLLAPDCQVVSRIFPRLLHSMHRYRLFGCLGIEKRVQYTSLLLITFLARSHHRWTLRVPICIRIL